MDLYKQMFYCVMFVTNVLVSTVRNYWRFLILIDIERKMDVCSTV